MQCITLLWQYNIHKTAGKTWGAVYYLFRSRDFIYLRDIVKVTKYEIYIFKVLEVKGPLQASQQ